MTIRYDSFPLGGLEKARKDDFGFLHVPANLTRVGVFNYRQANGTIRRELKPPEEFHSPRFLRTVARAIVTDEHPRPLGTPVTPQNAKQLSRGQLGSDVRVRGDIVEGDLSITHDSLIESVESGAQTEVSLGFKMRIDHTSGIWRGINGDEPPQPYDAIQRDPVCNHAAITRKARGGAEIRLRLDSDDAIMVSDSHEDEPTGKKTNMITITVDGLSIQVENETAASVIQAALKKRDDAAAKLQTDSADMKAQLDKAQAQIDAAADKAKKAQAQIEQLKVDSADPERISVLVRERTSLMSDAARLLSQDELAGLDSATDDEVRRTAVRKHTELACDSDENSDDYRSSDYVKARFDALVEDAGEKNHLRNAKVLTIAGSSRMRSDSAGHDKLNERIRAAQEAADGAWKNPQSNSIARKEA